jgi:hypothetical protein
VEKELGLYDPMAVKYHITKDSTLGEFYELRRKYVQKFMQEK